MFRKIISNLPFSPTLISELGFYAKRLRKEETTRRIGLILTALALVVQSFVAFSPPESANAANSGDLVYGGFKGRTEMLHACNNNTQGFRDLAARAGITCQNLANSKFTQVHSRVNGKDAGWLSWNRTARFSLQRGEQQFTIAGQTIFVRPLAEFDKINTTGNGSYYDAFVGKTSSGADYAIMIDCANIMLKNYPTGDAPKITTPAASYACTSLVASVDPSNRYRYNFTINGTSSGAKVHDYLINYGIGDPAVHSTTSNKFSHTYSKPGKYTVNSSIRFNVGGTVTKPITSNACNTVVEIVQTPTPTPTPTPAPTPAPKPIQVCDITTKKMITIDERNFDAKKHSKNPADCQPKPIQVCDITTRKMVTINERDFDAKKHSKNPDDCKAPTPTPLASCSSLTVKKVSRTEVELQGAATTANGATIRSYTYVIKDKDGKDVLRRTVNTTSSTSTVKHTIPQEGTYSAEVIVNTSIGDKRSPACQDSFTIEPIARCPLNPGLPINDPNCQPCPGDPTLWVKDEDCAAKVIRTKKATNLTAGAVADTVLAKASDRIEYTLTARNEGKDATTFNMEDSLIDLLEYSSLYDRGGGTLNEETKLLSWNDVTLQPGEEQTRTYVIQMQSKISPMPRGASDPTSYDCRMINTFGNSVEVNVDCPTPKVVEQVVPELPKTGPTENMIFGGVLAAIVTFLYFRTRQLDKEVRLIRREVTAGTI